MKIIALVPVRNEAWVLEHSLASLSGFCDAVIVSDQDSTDGSREICRRFQKVVLLESGSADSMARLPQQARWRLLDAARQYDGNNLLWCTDADELVSPALARLALERQASHLTPGRAIECRYYNLWNSMARYRRDLSHYGPQWKVVAFVDDRKVDFQRSGVRPLDEPRTPVDTGDDIFRLDDIPVLHLQWTIARRNQCKQAWYRCVVLIKTGQPAVRINETYSGTLPVRYAHTEAVPAKWLTDITLPDASIDSQPPWQEAEIFTWFDRHGIEFFEPLEIWHVPALRAEFRRRVGRSPRPDRSYMAPWPVRARRLGRRVFHAARRRILP